MSTVARRHTSRSRRRHPVRRALRGLGFYGWLVVAVLALVAYEWLMAHPIALAVLLCAVVTVAVVYVAWRMRGLAVKRMSPGRFEEYVAGLLARDGCRDVQVVGGANDLGADVIAYTASGLKVVAQCKRYTKRPVGSKELQTFGGTARPVHRAHFACMVTTSRFTEPARRYALQQGIHLVDGRALRAWRSGTMPAPWA